MSQDRPEVLSRSVQEVDLWLKQLKEELGLQSPDQAYGALRSVLHTLRDRLTVDSSAHFAAQLPVMLAGIYYDGWDPSKVAEKTRSADDFRDEVNARARGHEELDPAQATRSVFKLLRQKLSAGLPEKILQQLPDEIRSEFADAA